MQYSEERKAKMNRYDWIEEMSENDADLFKRAIRRLLDSTFILKEKDEVLYSYIKRSSNQVNISEYLKVIGYNLEVSDDFGVAMLKQNESDDDNYGLKRVSFKAFTGDETAILMNLWEIYLAKLETQLTVFTTYGDLISRIKFYDLDIKTTVIINSLRVLKRFSLIDFNSSDLTNNNISSEMPIRLYPSLMFCMNTDQMRAIMEEYMSDLEVINTADEELDSDIEEVDGSL